MAGDFVHDDDPGIDLLNAVRREAKRLRRGGLHVVCERPQISGKLRDSIRI